MSKTYGRVSPPKIIPGGETRNNADAKHIHLLDGWRALSILLVLAGHLLPLGPKAWGLNAPVAAAGMAIFFTLSGFLITNFLLARPDAPAFICRRAFRILPLAWVAVVILGVINHADLETWLANLLFVANLPPQRLLDGGGHLWSLGVEVQFYVAVALLVALMGRRGLYLLPVACLAITALRVSEGAYVDIVTWRRADEILAGATIALGYFHLSGAEWPKKIPKFTPLLLLVLVFAAAHPATGPLNYLRPYITASAVGISLFAFPKAMRHLFSSKVAIYIAQTSYAVYVFHGMLASTWLGSGDVLWKYAKRPLLLVVTFTAAHLSTFWFERPMIALGKRLSRPQGHSPAIAGVKSGSSAFEN